MGADAPGLKPIDPPALQASIERLAKELMLPGAMVLLSTPQGDVVFGYGTTELGTTNPPRADTHFRAASNTKTMTAAAIVQMVQEGKLGFDDPISKYVEGVPDGDEITISQLLKMRVRPLQLHHVPGEGPTRVSGGRNSPPPTPSGNPFSIQLQFGWRPAIQDPLNEARGHEGLRDTCRTSIRVNLRAPAEFRRLCQPSCSGGEDRPRAERSSAT